MDIDTIRYFGASYIMESELSPKEKCDMIDYVKEAEWAEILSLVFNGSVPTRKLTINEQYILEAQAENFIYPLIVKYMLEGPTTPKEDIGIVYTKTKELGKEGYKRAKRGITKHAPAAKRYIRGASIAVLVAAASAAGHRLYKIHLSKAARQCKGLSGVDRRSCIVKHKKFGLQAKLQSYAKAKTDCGGSKNPERCRRELDTKIKKVKYKMGTLYSRI